ncbi:unnamed protein product [Knipowitschia caucasica]|uniref:Uncharacterized protein n=1 Tax=Knipowitschia caucasica TaxID=637954 RepID=A0AAV2MIP6_KNICA
MEQNTELQKEEHSQISRSLPRRVSSELCRCSHITADRNKHTDQRVAIPLFDLYVWRSCIRVRRSSCGDGYAAMTRVAFLSSRDHSPIKSVWPDPVRSWLAGSHDGQVMESSIIPQH